MSIKFQRAVDRILGVPLCALFSLLDRFLKKPARETSPRGILIILLSEMGSLVLVQPMLAGLKRRYPNAVLHALVCARNREAMDLLGIIPREDVLVVDDSSFWRFGVGSLKVLRAVRALKCDVVIDCELFARISSIFSWLSGAPIRVGFHPHTQEGLYRGSFINRPVIYNPYQHISQQFMTLAAAIELRSTPAGKHTRVALPESVPALGFPDTELQETIARFHKDFPSVEHDSLVLVYPGGGLLPIRAWPLEHYFRVASELVGDGYAVGIIGLEGDKALAQAILAHCASPRCVDLTGYTKSLRHLLMLFHRASLLITNDGGPAHFAALTPLPAIILFGPETPVLYRPLSPNAHCFHLSLPCSPCLTASNHRTSPCDGDNQCLKQIAPERVLAKARQILGRRETEVAACRFA